VKGLTTAALLLGACALSACSSLGSDVGSGLSSYSAVNVKRTAVGDGRLSVIPPRPWNRSRDYGFNRVGAVEEWTLNGPLLDEIMFVAGLKSGQSVVRQWRSDTQQVPVFRSDMTPPEITSLVESLFRVRAGTVNFKTLAIKPRPFLGANGFQFDFEHLDEDELWRKGRAVGAVINDRLYLILYDAARSHYYEAALPDFEAIAASAQLR
jgi:hypothetical protein